MTFLGGLGRDRLARLPPGASARLGDAARTAHQRLGPWPLLFARDDLDAFLSRRRQPPDRLSIISSDFDVGGSLLRLQRLTTGSVWPAALAHSGFNILWERCDGCTETKSPLVVEYLAGESGVLTLFALAVLAGRLGHRRKTKQVCFSGPSFLTGLSPPMRRPLLCILAIQIIDFPFHLTNLHRQFAHLPKIIAIGFEHELLAVFL